MKKFLVLIFLFLPLLANATVYTARINAASVNIPTSFSTGAASLVLSGVIRPKALFIDNQTGSEVAVNCTNSATIAPSNSTAQNIYVQTLEAWAIDVSYVAGNCYIRSNSGAAITTGILVVTMVQ